MASVLAAAKPSRKNTLRAPNRISSRLALALGPSSSVVATNRLSLPSKLNSTVYYGLVREVCQGIQRFEPWTRLRGQQPSCENMVPCVERPTPQIDQAAAWSIWGDGLTRTFGRGAPTTRRDRDPAMRTLVTGSSGRLGRWVVRTLLDAGHEVVGADRQRPPDDGGARHRTVNLTDVGQVAGAMAGCDAVVHLGAIPGLDRYPDEVVFGNNTLSTFAVVQAASLLGVSRAVVASSGSALGMSLKAAALPAALCPRGRGSSTARPGLLRPLQGGGRADLRYVQPAHGHLRPRLPLPLDHPSRRGRRKSRGLEGHAWGRRP